MQPKREDVGEAQWELDRDAWNLPRDKQREQSQPQPAVPAGGDGHRGAEAADKRRRGRATGGAAG